MPPSIRHHAFSCGEGKPYRRFVFWLSKKYVKRLILESSDYNYLIDKAHEGHYYHHLEASHFQEIQAKAIRVIEEVHGNRYGKETFLHLYVSDLTLSLTSYLYDSEQLRIPVRKDTEFHRSERRRLNPRRRSGSCTRLISTIARDRRHHLH